MGGDNARNVAYGREMRRAIRTIREISLVVVASLFAGSSRRRRRPSPSPGVDVAPLGYFGPPAQGSLGVSVVGVSGYSIVVSGLNQKGRAIALGAPEGSVVHARASVSPASGPRVVTHYLTVLGGTGRYLGASGGGTMTVIESPSVSFTVSSR